jgi:hypothetical protein
LGSGALKWSKTARRLGKGAKKSGKEKEERKKP